MFPPRHSAHSGLARVHGQPRFQILGGQGNSNRDDECQIELTETEEAAEQLRIVTLRVPSSRKRKWGSATTSTTATTASRHVQAASSHGGYRWPKSKPQTGKNEREESLRPKEQAYTLVLEGSVYKGQVYVDYRYHRHEASSSSASLAERLPFKTHTPADTLVPSYHGVRFSVETFRYLQAYLPKIVGSLDAGGGGDTRGSLQDGGTTGTVPPPSAGVPHHL